MLRVDFQGDFFGNQPGRKVTFVVTIYHSIPDSFFSDPYRIAQINALSVNMCCAYSSAVTIYDEAVWPDFLSISAHVNNAFYIAKVVWWTSLCWNKKSGAHREEINREEKQIVLVQKKIDSDCGSATSWCFHSNHENVNRASRNQKEKNSCKNSECERLFDIARTSY